LLRRVFPVTKAIAQARVYASGLGYHELRINGRKVGNHVLEGEVTDYRQRVGYLTYDATSYLHRGANAIGVLLGRGFYDVHQPTPLDWHLAPWRDQPKLILRLVVRYTDGTTDVVVSDGGWQATDGPITYDSVYGGEDYDARIDPSGWDTASFNPVGWVPARLATPPQGRLTATNNDPVEVVDTLTSVATTQPRPGV
jgi:alpha-L-rhamnosidase